MSDPSVAIAFGGGGARGLAHIHVVRALEELGIRPVAISGTSIGSIIGSGLASGMSADDMLDYAVTTFSDSGEVLSRLWSMRPASLDDMFSAPGLPWSSIDPKRTIRAFVPEVIPDRFDDLDIPMQIVATDFYGQQAEIIEHGDLYEAMAASSALPAIFTPVVRGGATLIDGGIVNAVPYELLFDKADIVVAIDVVGSPEKSRKAVPTRIEALAGACQLMMRATTQLKCKIQPPHVYVEPPVAGISMLDFLNARHIVEATAGTVEITKRAINSVLQG
jgi:NTE family protein